MKLNNYDLWVKCSEWGSFVCSDDPGACMYGFSENSGFQDRNHAQTVLDHTKDVCLDIASNDDDRQDLKNIIETAEAYLKKAP